jgi:hypothetical protein
MAEDESNPDFAAEYEEKRGAWTCPSCTTALRRPGLAGIQRHLTSCWNAFSLHNNDPKLIKELVSKDVFSLLR